MQIFGKDISLQKVLGSIGAGPQGDSVVGVDFGSSALKAVQIRKKGNRAVLETYGEIALGPYAENEVGLATNLPAEKLKEALADLFREANVTTTNGSFAIPMSSSLVMLAEMPDLGERRMPEMIPIEARRYIPVPISEVSLDWIIIPKEDRVFVTPEESGKSDEVGVKKVDVLLVAILKDALQKYTNVAKDLGITDPSFEIELFSTVRGTLESGIEPVMIFDFGASSTKLYIVEHGIVRDSHIINRGSQDITRSLSNALQVSIPKAEELKRSVGISLDPSNRAVNETITLLLDYIFSEANRVLLAFEKKFNKTVGKVLLTGGGIAMKGFSKTTALHFQNEIEIADPFAKVVAPAFLGNVLKEVGPEFSVALGVALAKLTRSP
ncbi:MAG: pilus assembly protein PilM [Patescibacteria group bacterium]